MELVFRVAGLPVSVEVPESSQDLVRRAGKRYGRFLDVGGASGGPEAFVLRLDVAGGPLPAGAHPEWVDNPPLTATGDMSRMTVEGEGFGFEMDWEARQGRGTIPDALSHLDLAVRLALGVDLLRRGDCLLHAGAVTRDRFALAFVGPSGAGKSTIVRLAQNSGCVSLGDDLIAVRRTELATRIHGSPFWHGENRSAPAGGLFVLEQADEPALEWMHPTRAIPALIAAGGAPVDLPDVQRAFFDAAARVVRHVPTYRLAFRRDDSFWNVIDARPEFAFFRPKGRPPA